MPLWDIWGRIPDPIENLYRMGTALLYFPKEFRTPHPQRDAGFSCVGACEKTGGKGALSMIFPMESSI